MAVVVIAGVPKNQKLLKFISFLHGLVGDIAINANLIKTKYTNDFAKKIFVTVRSNEARRLRRAIDGYIYKYAGRDYPLKCWQEDNDEVVTRYPEPKDEGLEYSQPSEDLDEELQSIDQKIELVRKERVLIEEESRLLLEKKKLQILKHIGVNDVDNFKKFLEMKDRNNPAEVAELFTEVIDKSILQRKLSCNKLPHFHGPCKAIFAEMRDVINKYINPDNRAILLPLIRSTIKKRLVVVLQGKKPMVVPDIVQEYREQYPIATDDEMLQALIVTITQSCWPKPGCYDEGQHSESEAIVATDMENEKDIKNIINLKSEDVNTCTASTNDTQVKDMTIIDPEDADVIDVDNDFDEWIEEDPNQNLDSKNVLNESNGTDNTKCTIGEQVQQNIKAEVKMEEVTLTEEDSKEKQIEVVKIKKE